MRKGTKPLIFAGVIGMTILLVAIKIAMYLGMKSRAKDEFLQELDRMMEDLK